MASATPDLAALASRLDGEVQGELLHRRLHAADASLYEELPLAVVRPRHADDITATVAWAARSGIPITARAAGTSLAGQATGGGIILDVSRHMTAVLRIDTAARCVEVQPGVIRDDLNDVLAPTGLHFGPDTSTSNRCMIGGMIGNNSCGEHSVAYGTTREHTRWVDAVLSDGSRVRFEALSDDAFAAKLRQDDLEGRIYRTLNGLLRTHRDEILRRFPRPQVTRRNTGYCLDLLARMRPWTPAGEPCNLAKLICGSEGSLALVAAAGLNLVERPRHRLLVAGHFRHHLDACRAAVVAVRHRCYAGELMDDIILQATKRNLEQARNRAWIEGDPGAILAIEMEDADPQALRARVDALVAELRERALGYAWPVLQGAQIDRVWALRKASLGLLMGIVAREKAVPVIEDTAVDPEVLPDYIAAVDEIMAKHGTRCVHYAHAAAGELHLRPELDLRKADDVARLERIASDIADLVARFGGSLSGEHGDGRVRAPFIERVLGPEMVALLRQVKQAFDPRGILNRGKIVDPEPLTKDFRTHPGTPLPEVATAFDWSAQLGLVRATEQCNGAGACRKSPGRGTMCPSYHATKEELHTTRGRANLFRQLLTSDDPTRAFTGDELAEAMALCLGCKACKAECPANVDLARLKAEFLHQRHRRLGTSFADRVFGRFARGMRRARLAPGIAGAIAGSAPMRRLLGIDRRRSLPRAARRGVLDRRPPRAHVDAARGTVVLAIDEFTDLLEPEIGVAAIELLERAGYQVVALRFDSARAAISRGLLDEAREALTDAVAGLHPHAARGTAIVGIEPSAILGLLDEASDLLPEERRAEARAVAARVMLVEDFLAAEAAAGRFGDLRWDEATPRRILVHGHCHQKALVGTGGMLAALRLIPGAEVSEIPSGCCGMAGSFGYQHYEVSMAIGEQILLPAVRAADSGTVVCAPGTSCRHQLLDGTGRHIPHPVQVLRDALRGREGVAVEAAETRS